MSTVVGIDVGGERKGFHGAAFADGRLKDRIATPNAIELAGWCRTMQATTVAVDAPCMWSTDGRARQAEVRLMGERIWCFATPTRVTAVHHPKNQFGWMLAGERLYGQLGQSFQYFGGQRQPGLKYFIETFPHAVVCALLGSVVSARNKSRVRREVLHKRGVDVTMLPNIDYLDAALCAVAAGYFETGAFKAYGSPADGYIVLPLTEAEGCALGAGAA